MADLFDELNESIDEENFQETLKKLVPYIVAGVLAIIASTIFYVNYSNYNQAINENSGDKLYEAVTAYQTNSDEVMEIFDEINKADSGDTLPALLGIMRAEMALSNENRIDSIQYLNVAAESAKDQILSDLSRIYKVSIALDQENLDDSILADLQYLLSINTPFRSSALFLKSLYHIKDNNNQAARESIAVLESETNFNSLAPGSLEILRDSIKE